MLPIRLPRGASPLSLLLLAVLPLGAAAQQVTSPYRFVDETQAGELFGGYAFTDPGAVELGALSGPVFGGRYSIRLNGPFTIEAAATYYPGSRAVVDTVRTLPDSGFAVVDTASLNLLLLTGGLRFNLTGSRTWNGLMPYFLAIGGAVIDLSPDDPADRGIPADARFDFGTSFAGGFGGGVDWFVRPRVTIRLDARDILWKVDTPERFRALDLDVPDDEWVQNIMVSVGASLRF